MQTINGTPYITGTWWPVNVLIQTGEGKGGVRKGYSGS